MNHVEIWLLDDDPYISKAIKAALENYGFKVLTFEKYRELSILLKKKVPNLLLMDVLLNDEDGLALTKKIHETVRYANLPIVLISANNLKPEELIRSKATGFLKKPFELNDLHKIVLQFLNIT